MIDRKTTLVCVLLIALMLGAAAIVAWNGEAIGSVQWPLSLPLVLVFPVCSTLVTAALYSSSRSAIADDAKREPWYRWGRFLSISYCAGMLLLQGMQIAPGFGLPVPSPVVSTLRVVMAIMSLLAINQMPKLPWFECRSSPGGELGPVYGPRYVRIVSRIAVLFMLAVFACGLVASSTMGVRAVACILLGTALIVIWSVIWRRHLGHKWRLERGGAN